jgi:hypothetical protein
MKRPERNALNRGTAVYVGGSRVRFIWPCGCSRVETIKGRKNAAPPDSVARLVPYWRRSGVVLPQCHRHPDWFHKDSQVARLNKEYPQP